MLIETVHVTPCIYTYAHTKCTAEIDDCHSIPRFWDCVLQINLSDKYRKISNIGAPNK